MGNAVRVAILTPCPRRRVPRVPVRRRRRAGDGRVGASGSAPARLWRSTASPPATSPAGPGSRFPLDPNFLAYDTVPIRVEVELRRNGDASAGFNLK